VHLQLLIGLQIPPITAALPKSPANTLFGIPRSESSSTNGFKIRYSHQIIRPTKEAVDVQVDAEEAGMTIDYAAHAG
jgi:hypothetical protein